jgi:hypothetical protein
MSGRPVAVFLRPGKTPDGTEVCLVLRHVVRAIRARWPRVDILIRGDSHYGRPEGMAWRERNRVGHIFGLAGNKVLLRRVAVEAEQVGLVRLNAPAESKVRRYGRTGRRRRGWPGWTRRRLAYRRRARRHAAGIAAAAKSQREISEEFAHAQVELYPAVADLRQARRLPPVIPRGDTKEVRRKSGM